MPRTNQGKSALGSAVLVGCIALMLLGSGVVAFVLTNWNSVSDYYEKAVGALGEVRAVQAALQKRYRTSDIRVRIERTTQVEGSTLSLEIEDAAFLGGLDSDAEWRQKALEVAAVARAALPPARGYPRYKVTFTSRKGMGATLSRTRSFVIHAGDLPPR